LNDKVKIQELARQRDADRAQFQAYLNWLAERFREINLAAGFNMDRLWRLVIEMDAELEVEKKRSKLLESLAENLQQQLEDK
jgi:hypothetical protein